MAQTVTHITEHVSSQVRAYMLSQGLSNVSESDLSELKLHVAYKQTNSPAKSEWTHKWNLLRGEQTAPEEWRFVMQDLHATQQQETAWMLRCIPISL